MNDIKINIGGGYKRYDGFLNIDIDPNTKPDNLMNLDDPNLQLPFDNDTVSEVKAYHILEHIGDNYFKVLQELYRVCKRGAIIDIQVPHPFHEVYLNDPTHKRPITVEGMRLFSKKYNQHQIDTHNSCSGLGLRFNVDFELVSWEFVPDPFYDEIVKRNTQEQNIRLFRECVNVCQEIHMKLVVVK
jgi:hypothetical protein